MNFVFGLYTKDLSSKLQSSKKKNSKYYVYKFIAKCCRNERKNDGEGEIGEKEEQMDEGKTFNLNTNNSLSLSLSGFFCCCVFPWMR